MVTTAQSGAGLQELAERAFLQTTAEGAAIVDTSGCVAFVNERMARMLGVDAARLVGRRALDLVASSGADDGLSFDPPCTQLRVDGGRIVWVQLASAPLLGADGATLGTLWLATDVSGWRRTQQALQTIADTSRALGGAFDVDAIARAVAKSIAGGVVIGMLEGEGAFAVRACAVVDPRVEEQLRALVGRVAPLVPGTVGAEVVRTREGLLLRGEGVGRLHPMFVRLAGQFALGSVIVVPLLVHGRVTGVMSAFRAKSAEPLEASDVSLLREIGDRAAMALERARLFDEQRRATDRLRLLADAGTLIAQSLELGATMTGVARAAAQWFADVCAVRIFEGDGVVPHAVVSRDPTLEERTRRVMERYLTAEGPPAVTRHAFDLGRPTLVRAIDDVMLRGLAMDDAHLTALRGLGLRSLIVVPLLARGVPLGIVSLARTGGSPYDEEDLGLAEEVGRRAALAIDNARLFRSANEAVALRDEFLSIASHELNTPLTPLKMQLDSLRRGRFPPERQAEKLDAAARQVTRLTKLVSELLDVSRIRGGRLHLEPETFDLAALLDEVVGRMVDVTERAGVSIVVRAERPCTGSWDRMRIDQVVTNLLTNAVKYAGGKPVTITLVRTPKGVRLTVSDQGIGIAPEDQRRIFERFERAASPRHYGGFGLGLWIARQIVESSGGTIAVDSVPGKGATFVVDLPA